MSNKVQFQNPFMDGDVQDRAFYWDVENDRDQASVLVYVRSGSAGPLVMKWEESHDRNKWVLVKTLVIEAQTGMQLLFAPRQRVRVSTPGTAGVRVGVFVEAKE